MQVTEIQRKKMSQSFPKKNCDISFRQFYYRPIAVPLTYQLINSNTKEHNQKHYQDSKQQQNPLHGLHRF